MQVAAVILAAGAARRFGSPKQQARIGGRSMLATVAAIAREAGLRPVIAVVPPGIAVPPYVVPGVNADPDAGLSRSLRLGLGAVPPEAADAAVILLGDQPTLDPTIIQLLVLEGGGRRPVVAARAEGRIGPPILLRREAFHLADEASGDEGLREVLGRHPALVAEVGVGEHAPDVDRVEDLDRIAPACPGCGARYRPTPPVEGHRYVGASSACWAAFGEVLAREFQDPAYGRIHRHTVDVYAAQHPGVDGRRERQSVALHLVALCHWLEHGLEARDLNPITQRLANEEHDWPWLDPPSAYALTVPDLLRAESGDEHVRLVRSWAEATWEAWSAHHPIVRAWAADAIESRR